MTQLEGNTEKYAGGRNTTALARCVADRTMGILSVTSVDRQSLYRLSYPETWRCIVYILKFLCILYFQGSL